jgi:hypothetical protein
VPDTSAAIDLPRILEELRGRARARRAIGGYAIDDLADDTFDPAGGTVGLSEDIGMRRTLALVDANPYLAQSNRPAVGPLITQAKRGFALAVRQFVGDVADQVTRYQLHATEVAARHEEALAIAEARIAALEDAVRRLGGALAPAPYVFPAAWRRALIGRTPVVVVDDGPTAASLRAAGFDVRAVATSEAAAEQLRLGGFPVDRASLEAWAEAARDSPVGAVVVDAVPDDATLAALRRAMGVDGVLLVRQYGEDSPADRDVIIERLPAGGAVGRFAA